MKLTALMMLLLGIAATTAALDINIDPYMEEKPEGPGGLFDGDRVGGDTIALAAPIGTIPFTDTGYTCDYNDDYDEECPYTGSTSPDVVYSYAPGADLVVNIDLCNSIYDTKVYVYENDESTLVACNDDACSWQSNLYYVELQTGNTYYIVVDGYGGSCGYYTLEITEWEPCFVECPPEAMPEGEPTCYPDYYDSYNGGCQVEPYPVFQPIPPDCDGTIVICAETGVFPYGTSTYRDVDYFEITLTETAYICVGGQYACEGQTLIIDGRYGCGGLLIPAYYISGICEVFSDLCWLCDPGIWWIWGGPANWGDWPCGTIYWLEISGYTGGVTPAASSTWGDVKALFR